MNIAQGDVVQGNENAKDWCGTLLYVDEVRRSWGVIAHMIIPYKGEAFIRLPFDAVEKIGHAVMHPVRDEDENNNPGESGQ